MTISMLDKWDYSGVGTVCYSDERCESYKKAAEFLGLSNPVEDWGGGTGWAKMYFTGPYKNIDGSQHPNVDVVADLVRYNSKVDNILMRQVLEFNWEWKRILSNVKKSFSKKFCLVVMTPLVEVTKIDRTELTVSSTGEEVEGSESPCVYFNKQDILDYFPESEYKVTQENIETNGYWGGEWILYVEKI